MSRVLAFALVALLPASLLAQVSTDRNGHLATATALTAGVTVGSVNTANNIVNVKLPLPTDKEIKKVTDKLKPDDPKDAVRDARCKIHVQRMKAGRRYTIDMVSNQFDSYLRLEDSSGNQLDEDDDSGGMLNAQIVFNCSKDGDYKICCTSFNPQGTGEFTLTVKESTAAAKVVAAQQSVLGKAAPDFQPAFAINGNPVKLSDLKGKVVLLAFWEVQSPPCVATFPRLRQWHKTYSPQGLALVGVTFANFEIGQKLGFDRAAGELKRLEKASKETEQAMLQAYAAHHHLEHLLLVLSGKDALDAFNAYLVNGLPQFALVDRHGVVRMIRVGEDERTTAALEAEFKSLLAEK
jgi:thiol-disulfide isomerase/thioredoxin